MPARRDIKSILIIGSGPIVIGQACEFDYSGNQAVRALREEGYRTIIVNPNPATVMTTPGNADAVYLDPLEPEYLEEIIRFERPDAVLATMGGQTALNLSMRLSEMGIFKRYGVEVIGASIESIRLAEDRGAFKSLMSDIGLESPRSELVGTPEEARGVIRSFGLPLIVRPSYTLGGKGGSIVETAESAEEAVRRALAESPVGTALIEESLIGWKEFELEVMRDAADNAVVVCSIENIDPMGIHTGDSITVAPIQTLSDREYQHMRSASIDILRAVGVDCGGSNVQFAYNPENGRMLVIEMNPRVSRSSALASKATGFPIARASARLAVGYTLDEVINEITGKTVSSFEPALDYVAAKVPRFEIEKFPSGYSSLGTQMKSVGESLALGRTFLEALNKALRAAEIGVPGLVDDPEATDDELRTIVTALHPRRIFAIYTLIRRALATDDLDNLIKWIADESGYDRWVLHHLRRLAELERDLTGVTGAVTTDGDNRLAGLLPLAKRLGLIDERIAALTGRDSATILALREEHGVLPSYHFVDTCAGEFEAATPYFYSSWGEIDEGGPSEEAVLIVGSGPNRIGQGLEFDTCCTLASEAFRRRGYRTIMINSNPETVSTDFNVSDRLYIEPLTSEDVGNVIRKEQVRRVVVQLGGQTPLNMSHSLESFGVEIQGTSLDAIDRAEDRGEFSRLIEALGLRQPPNGSATSVEEIARIADRIGYPVLLRPSYVLGGRSMMIAFSRSELDRFVEGLYAIDPDRPVLVDRFLEDAFEYDVDAVSDGHNVYVGGIMQHIEAAGVHSGDSACVFPPFKSDKAIETEILDATVSIARTLGIRGLLNIQFAVQEGILYVLEVNPRASRTVPFLSKASGVDLIDAAVAVWTGQTLVEYGLVGDGGVARGDCIAGWAVKEAMFSFDRFSDHDPILGPEMRSTGESIGLGSGFGEAFAKATIATGTRLPREGRVFVTVNDHDKETIVPIVRELASLGFEIAATRGTAEYLFQQGILAEVLLKVHEGHPHMVDHLRAGRVDLIINTPLGRYTHSAEDTIRIEALRHHVPYTSTTSAAWAAVQAIRHLREEGPRARVLPGPRDTRSRR